MTLEEKSDKLPGGKFKTDLDKLLDEVFPVDPIIENKDLHESDPTITNEIGHLKSKVENGLVVNQVTQEVKSEKERIINQLLEGKEKNTITKLKSHTNHQKDIGNPQDGLPVEETNEDFIDSQYVVNKLAAAKNVEDLTSQGFFSSGISSFLIEKLGLKT